MKLIFTVCGIILAIMLIMQAFTNKNKTNKKDLQEMIKSGAYLVDVRTPEEYNEGHVLGSVNIPLDKIEEKFDSFKNKKQIIVFCHSGQRSQMAKDFLEKNGIQNVTNGGSWTAVAELIDNQTK